MAEALIEILRTAWLGLRSALVEALPRLLAMAIIVVVGWIVSFLLGAVTHRLLSLVRFNAFCERTGVGEVLRRAELPPADVSAGRLVFWTSWLGFLLAGINALGFAVTRQLVEDVLALLPHVLVALAILVFGLLLANFVSRAALLAALNADVPSPRLLARFAWLVIVVLSVTMALEQIGVARAVVLTAFALAFGAVMLAGALAFGIGGRDLARKILEHHFAEVVDENGGDDEIRHV